MNKATRSIAALRNAYYRWCDDYPLGCSFHYQVYHSVTLNGIILWALAGGTCHFRLLGRQPSRCRRRTICPPGSTGRRAGQRLRVGGAVAGASAPPGEPDPSLGILERPFFCAAAEHGDRRPGPNRTSIVGQAGWRALAARARRWWRLRVVSGSLCRGGCGRSRRRWRRLSRSRIAAAFSRVICAR